MDNTIYSLIFTHDSRMRCLVRNLAQEFFDKEETRKNSRVTSKASRSSFGSSVDTRDFHSVRSEFPEYSD